MPGVPAGPIPGMPGSPEWAAQQAAQAVGRSAFRRRRITMSAGVAGSDDDAQDLNVHIIPTKGQARARKIVAIAMAVMFVVFVTVFVIVAIHIFHSSTNPGFGG
jgi:hypothetical protein